MNSVTFQVKDKINSSVLCVFVCEHGFIRIIFELLGKFTASY